MEKTDNLTIGLVGAGGDGVVVLGSLLQRLAAGEGISAKCRNIRSPNKGWGFGG